MITEITKYEFHISKSCRDYYNFDKGLFAITGNVIFADLQTVKLFAEKINKTRRTKGLTSIRPGHLNAMGLIDEILHYVLGRYRKEKNPAAFKTAFAYLQKKFGKKMVTNTLIKFVEAFPPLLVYQKKITVLKYLKSKTNQLVCLEEMLMLYLANENPAFSPFFELFDDKELAQKTLYKEIISALNEFFKTQPVYGPYNQFLIELLRAPVIAAPHSLTGQLLYIKEHWGLLLSPELVERFFIRILVSLDFIKEEERSKFLGPGPAPVLRFTPKTEFYQEFYKEEERFSPDTNWMPGVIMIAKHTYVWFFQLSKKYGRPITKLNEIPDEELDILANWGFTAIWLIGIWERTKASQKIKQKCGNPEAMASAYAIYDYEVAQELGGEDAFNNLKQRAAKRNIRIGVDMVPNHTGIYSKWLSEHPDWYIQSDSSPFPRYSFTGPDLSLDPKIGIYIEDGYWNKTDAAVVFKFTEPQKNKTRFIYHGNDGTSMPWNDTAQLNFLLPEVREAVIQKILDVAKKSQIIRLDAAMTLTKKHYQRLWFPEPGKGGDIPSRVEHGMPKAEFNRLFPKEFWREVVDRIAREVPDTLLLAEAFWLMEGYFVRSLGMHRVYNSAFMNMLKLEENRNYRAVIKNVLGFNPEILRRFVNFMNNPDELPAITQFGNGDKYFGVTMMMITMPGLPMFGHGQIEGFSEKYGMEYSRAYWDEKPDWNLVQRHIQEIFPLLKKRYLFSGVENFLFYDFCDENGKINENVFAYSNRYRDERALILYNHKYQFARGWLKISVPFLAGGKLIKKSLAQGLGLKSEARHYYIFREHQSKLWYIREARGLDQHGLYVALGAYKSHIFLDFQEIKDNETSDYEKLTTFLSGRGIPDIAEALNEMKLGPVLEPFREIMQPELLNRLVFYENRNLFEQKMHKLLISIKNFTGLKEDESAINNYLNDLLRIITVDLDGLLTAESKRLNRAIDYIRSQNIDKKLLLIWLVVYGIVKIKGEKETDYSSDEWFFTKVIKETLQNLGFNQVSAERYVLLVKILAGDQYLFEETEKSSEKIMKFFEHSELQKFLNVHVYEGVLWFNKENFEDLVYWLFLISVIKAFKNYPNDKKRSLSRILNRYRLAKKLLKLSRISGYRFEKLLESSMTIFK